uniref:Isochorismatase-like domain-containing protein n=1 Tax=Plectus sambesii TaxID=2011161 RepID=A0A914WYG0_9BILA
MKNKFGLLVIDMQERFRPVISKEMILQLNNTMRQCREKQIPVIFTQHGHKNLETDGGVLNEWWNGDLSIVGDASWQLLPELELDKSYDCVIDQKRRYDAFHGTALEDMLHQKNVRDKLFHHKR